MSNEKQTPEGKIIIEQTKPVPDIEIIEGTPEINEALVLLQSQQPLTIPWLSDSEIKEMFPISVEKQDSVWQTSKREGARVIQSELQKRVNAVDPIEFHQWMSEKYVRVYGGQHSGKYFDRYSPFEEIYFASEELLQIYLSEKQK